MRIKLTLEYDGTNYCGWQIQPNGVTVQQQIENAVLAVTGEKVSVTASGRTDSGVHALGQVAHFDTNSSIPPERFAPALNSALPSDVRVLKSTLVSEEFHSRFSAKKKTYAYKFYVSDVIRPLTDRYAAFVAFPLDFAAMKRVCELFIGTKDFRAFMATGSEVSDTVRTVYDAKITLSDDGVFTFTVTGNGFLYNMVRIMAGTLVAAGEGKISRQNVLDAFSSGNRNLLGKTMPARGLTLVSVEYPCDGEENLPLS